MTPRFGPLTDRELDIAEWTARKTLAYIIDAARKNGLPAIVVAEAMAAQPELRGELREKIEAAS